MLIDKFFESGFFAMIRARKDDEKLWSETVQVGDFVDGTLNRFYTFSEHQYETKGKLYEVREVDIRKDQDTGEIYSISVIVDGDYRDPKSTTPERLWLSPGKVIYRNGVPIWESRHIKSVKNTLATVPMTAEKRIELEDLLFKPVGDNFESTKN